MVSIVVLFACATSPTDEHIKKAVAEGVKGMDGYKDKLAPDQIDGLVVRPRAEVTAWSRARPPARRADPPP